METQPYFGYVSTLSLKSTLIINELHFSPWPRPDGSPVAIAENTYGNLVTLHGNAYRSSVTLHGNAYRSSVTLHGDAYRSSVTLHGDACGGLVAIAETIASENRYSAWR